MTLNQLEKKGWTVLVRPPEDLANRVRVRVSRVKRQLGMKKNQYLAEKAGISEFAASRILQFKSVYPEDAEKVEAWMEGYNVRA